MAIGSNKPVISVAERRRGRIAGSNYGKLFRETSATLPTAILPDETGTLGCGIGTRNAISTAQTANTLYAVYLGRATGAKTLNTVSVRTSAVGTGTPSAAVGLGTTDAAPDFTNKTITLQASASIVTTGGGSGRRGNTTALAYTPAAGVHIWALFITNNSLTQASADGLTGDVGVGQIQVLAGQTVAGFVPGAVYSMARPTPGTDPSTAIQSPQLYVS